MAQFSKLIVTQAGQELISGMLAGTGSGVRFTRVCVSAAEYDLSEAEKLTELADIRMTSPISHAERSGENTVTVECSFTNETLGEGFYIRTIGLLAETADGGEILFAVTAEQSGNCYMPPFKGITVSGVVVKLIVAVGNAESISIETNSAAVAAISDIRRLEQALEAHNSDENAHGSLLGNISQLEGEVARLEGEVAEIKLRVDTNITANPFSVTFKTLNGVSVSGVYNAARGTVDF